MAWDDSVLVRALSAVRQLRHEELLWRRLHSIGHLLSGSFAGMVLGLVAFAVTARALGPTEYGILALIFTFTRVIEYLVAFQSWQPLISYGAGLTGPEHHSDLKILLKFGLLLDLGASFTGWILALVVVFAAQPIFGWDDRTTTVMVVYSTVLLFRVGGMPTAVLRMADRFRLMAYNDVFVAAVRLMLCTIGMLMGGKLLTFALIWAATQMLSPLLLLALGFRELNRRGVRRVLRAPISGVTRRFPGIINFAWSTNLSLSLQTSTQQADTLLVGALADPAAAGFYHIAKRVGRLTAQVGLQAQAVLYPDLARFWARLDVRSIRRSVAQIEVILGCYGAAAFVFIFFAGPALLRWTAGPAFEAAAPLMVVQMLAVTLTLTGAAVRVALLAMSMQRDVLRIVFVAAVSFHATALLLIPQVGAMGANIAHVVFGLIWLGGLTMAFRRAIKLNSSGAATPRPGEAEAPH